MSLLPVSVFANNHTKKSMKARDLRMKSILESSKIKEKTAKMKKSGKRIEGNEEKPGA